VLGGTKVAYYRGTAITQIPPWR